MEYKAYVIIDDEGRVYDYHYGGFKTLEESHPAHFIYNHRDEAEEKISWAEYYKSSTSFDPDRNPGSYARGFLSHNPQIKEVTFATNDL